MIGQTEQQSVFENQERRLLQPLLELLAAPQLLQQIKQLAVDHGQRLSHIEKTQCLHENGLQELEGLQQKQSQALEAFYQRQNCLDEASRQQTLLSQQHFDKHIIEPLARRIFPLIDMLTENGPTCQYESVCNSHLEAFEAFKSELLDLLASYGVEPIHVANGSVFDAKTMQPADFVDAGRPGKDMTVKAVIRLGFRHETRILRPAKVNLYRFNGSQVNTQQVKKERISNHE